MPLVTGVGGFVSVQQGPVTGSGAPPASFRGQLGQEYFDISQTPPVLYIYNGQSWSTSLGALSVSSLTVTGAITAASTSISGNETVGGTLAVTGLSTLTGGINTAPVVVGAAASPQVANGRSGTVTFSSVSIAAGATQTFLINNSAVPATASIIWSMVGATTGSALSIASVTNSTGVSSSIVVTNGAGATTTTANITFSFLILN